MKQENHETRTFSRVFNIFKPCLRLNVRFFMKVTVLLAVVAKSLLSKKTGTIDSARDERNESLCQDELPETLKIILFTIHVEI